VLLARSSEHSLSGLTLHVTRSAMVSGSAAIGYRANELFKALPHLYILTTQGSNKYGVSNLLLLIGELLAS
jgi:hypothetical protein